MRLFNNIARNIMTVNNIWTDLGYYGAGQIVAVADTGLDNGKNDSTLAADFRGRLFNAYALYRTNDWSDDNGHGTHVAGSILGNGVNSGSNPTAHSYIGSFAGAAPEASLIFQSVGDASSYLYGLPSDLNELFTPPYADGARVHSNSWGGDVAGAYYSDSRETDQFIWNHKDMVIVVAAGNSARDINPTDGYVDPGSMATPATAKNCITVGASENQTSAGITATWGVFTDQYGTILFPSTPISNDRLSNNPRGMAAFSSRGPCSDGRIKPDICAPGTNIISCRSHDASAGTLWGSYNAHYCFSGGTSMATPLVSGACALVRQFYAMKSVSNPSAALVKATLLNGAFDMTPGQYSSPQEIAVRPNSVEGWGRLDLKYTLEPISPRNFYWRDVLPGLVTNPNNSTVGIDNYSYYVISNTLNTVPLRITLVWTDYPGSTIASKALVNDLDLTITGPTGTIYRGNGGSSADRTNNVEGIDIANPVTGVYTIQVKGYNVPYGPQPYALIVSGPVTTSIPASKSTITDVKALTDDEVVTLTGKIVSAGSDQFKNCFYIEEPDRFSGIRVQYGPGGGPTMTVGTTVTVTGTLATIDGERMLINPIIH
jgi:subtilisin family serine protease